MNESNPESSMNLSQKLVVVLADILVLAEVAWAMYAAGQRPDEFTPVFMKNFLIPALPTLIAAIVSVRLLRPKNEPKAVFELSRTSK